MLGQKGYERRLRELVSRADRLLKRDAYAPLYAPKIPTNFIRLWYQVYLIDKLQITAKLNRLKRIDVKIFPEATGMYLSNDPRYASLENKFFGNKMRLISKLKNKVGKILVGTLVSLSCLNGISYAGTPLLTGDVTYTSKYVGKDGSALSKGPAIQPHTNIGIRNISLDFWGNYDTKEKTLNEIDFTFGLTQSINKNFSLSAGYTYFYYPTDFLNETQEFYAGADYSGPVDIGL
jgi:hypothetical protein